MIRFDPDTHTYTYATDEGDITLPSVTQILDRAGLINKAWYTRSGQVRGTIVHSITAMIDQGLSVIWGDLDVAGYIAAYLTFKEESGFVPISVEKRVYDLELGYAGTVDRIGTLQDKTVILDIKTGAAEKWHGIQLQAYATALDKKYPLYGLYLRENGTYRLQKHRNTRDLKNTWISALNTYKAGAQ